MPRGRRIKEVPQSKQGQWTSWENLEHRRLTWRDLWEMEGIRLGFIIKVTYDVLPTPKNLHQWLGKVPTCALCITPATLRHILTSCKTSLAQGRYTWRHNQVLRQLAIILEGRRTGLLKRMGVKGQAVRQTVKSLSEAAEQSSNWLWIKRKDPN